MTQAQASVARAVPSLRGRGAAEGGVIAAVIAVLFLGVAISLPFVPGLRFYYLQVGILIFWFGMLGTSWSIVGGYGGMHSIGHAAFVGLGAYTSALLFVHYQISPWLGMVAGMALAAILAVIIGYPCFRFGIRGDFFALVTVALGEVMYEVANGASRITGGAQGVAVPYSTTSLANFQFDTRSTFYFVAFAMWLIVVFIAYRIRRSGFGFQLLALRDDEAAAERGGINVARRKIVALMISAAIAAAAGTFYAQFILFVDPASVFGLTLSVQIVLMAVLGGLNSYLGATVGALILVPTSQVLATRFEGHPGVDLAIYGAILVALVMYMPYGILGLLRKSPRWRRVIGW